MDTVRIEYMILNGSSVIQNWTNAEGSVQNDAQVYAPRALQLKDSYAQMLDSLEKEIEKFLLDISRLEKENEELRIRIKQLETEGEVK